MMQTMGEVLRSRKDFHVQILPEGRRGKIECACKEKLRKFRHWVRRVLKSFLRVLTGYRPESLNVSRGREAMSLAEESVPRRAGFEAADMPVGLWLAAILIFGFGDCLAYSLAFGVGAREVNPLTARLINALGGSLWFFVLVKTAVLAGLFFLSYYVLRRYGWLVPAFLCALGIYLVLTNLIAFFTII